MTNSNKRTAHKHSNNIIWLLVQYCEYLGYLHKTGKLVMLSRGHFLYTIQVTFTVKITLFIKECWGLF